MTISPPQLHELLPQQVQALQQREFRLAFFDIDGTLLGLDGHYSQRLKTAILQLRAAGVKTAVASGRPLFAADFLVRELQLQDAGVFYTGALLYDPQRQQTLTVHALQPELVQTMVAAAKSRQLYTEIYTRDHYYVERLTPLGELHSEHLRAAPRILPFTHMPTDEAVIKLLFAVEHPDEQARLFELEAEFPQAVFAYAKMAAKPDWLFVSVIAGSACKRQAFAQLLNYHQVKPEQVIAFGDAQSDKTFLELAGLGVAMGNAAEDVKQVADLVTAPVWDDGVAAVLEQLFPFHCR